MPTPLPDNLTDDDRLMLHLAGELPSAESAAVQARLERDAGAKQLADAFGRFDAALRADADAPHGHDLPAAAAARRVAAAFRAAEAPAAPKKCRWTPPAWTLYPVAAALVLAGLMGGWWYIVRDEFARPGVRYVDPSPPILALVGRPDKTLDQTNDFELDWQFSTMVVDGRWRDSPDRRFEEQLAGLDYLDEVTR